MSYAQHVAAKRRAAKKTLTRAEVECLARKMWDARYRYWKDRDGLPVPWKDATKDGKDSVRAMARAAIKELRG